MDTPRIFDTEMDGSAQETGQFFTSAYSSPGQLFGLNSQVNSPFQSSMSLKTPNMQIGSKSNQNPPELSTSPESSADSSSDGSSRRKRKSSSRSSHSGTDVNMADSGQPVSGSTPCIKREHAFDSNLSNTQSFDNYEFGNGEMYFDFSSAANSPDTQPSQSSPPNAAPLGYRIPYQDSPRSSQNLFPRSSASASVRTIPNTNPSTLRVICL